MNPTAHFADLSHYEPDVDFHKLAETCPFVITKCSEGTGYIDPTYQGFADRVRTVPDLIFGSYVFLDAAPASPQVDHYLSAAHLEPGDLQPVVDAEALGLTRAETLAAMTDLELRGYRPILYASLSFYKDVLNAPSRWWLWLAAYRDNLPALPPGTKLFAWQHSDHAVFPGVAKPCDGSYLYVSVDDLKEKFTIG